MQPSNMSRQKEMTRPSTRANPSRVFASTERIAKQTDGVVNVHRRTSTPSLTSRTAIAHTVPVVVSIQSSASSWTMTHRPGHQLKIRSQTQEVDARCQSFKQQLCSMSPCHPLPDRHQMQRMAVFHRSIGSKFEGPLFFLLVVHHADK